MGEYANRFNDMISLANPINSVMATLRTPEIQQISVKGPAEVQFEIIKEYVTDFQSSLDKEHDVGLLLTNFGQAILMEVTQIGFEGNFLMVFHGFVNGREATLIQNVNQLNFMLTTVERNPEKPKREIGFTANWAGQ